MQLWLNDVKVNEESKFLAEDPTAATYTTCVKGDDCDDEDLVILLQIHRVNSMFYSRKPTAEEVEGNNRWYELTYESPNYNPTNPTNAEQEEAMVNSSGHLKGSGDIAPGTYVQFPI